MECAAVRATRGQEGSSALEAQGQADIYGVQVDDGY